MSFYPVDEFAFDYGLAMDQDSAPSHFLGDVSISFKSSLLSGLEPTGISYAGDYPHYSMDTLDHQESAGLVPHDSIAFLEETQPVGILAPLVTDYVPATVEGPSFDGEISTRDTYWKDVKRYMDKHGRAPHLSAFVQEDLSFRPVIDSKSNEIPSNTAAIPVRKRGAPLPKRAKQSLSQSSITAFDSSDHTPLTVPSSSTVASFPETTSELCRAPPSTSKSMTRIKKLDALKQEGSKPKKTVRKEKLSR